MTTTTKKPNQPPPLPLDDPSLPLSTSNVQQPVRLRLGGGSSGPVSTWPPRTVLDMLAQTVTTTGDGPAHYHKTSHDDDWHITTWSQYQARIYDFGKALLSLGFNRYDMINIIGFNAPAWAIAHFGAMAAGGVPAGIYATNAPDACAYIVQHSQAKVVVCDGLAQLTKLVGIVAQLPSLRALVVYNVSSTIPVEMQDKCTIPIYTFDDFLQLGQPVTTASLHDRIQAWQPNQTCCLIYTSGTTGPPKAVMLTHDNITWTTRVMLSITKHGGMTEHDVMISYLPLSHIAAQMLDLYMPICTGCQVYFAQPDALKGSLGQTLKQVRPTMFFGVPRVWEKMYDKLQEVGKTSTGVKKMLSTWAKGEAASYWDAHDYDALKTFHFARDVPLGYYASKVLLSQVHAALGFDRCQSFYVSAAPIDVKVLRYFHSLDIPILELFGQSECCGPHAVNTPLAFKLGTVGRPMPGTETKLGDGDELCYRGRHIFAGYMGMPDQTAATIDADGYLHSGDVISMDDNHDETITKPSGFIRITGRIKELIITAGGENVPPVLIEEALKNAVPAISNAMVIGDKRKFLTTLLTLRVEVDGDGVPTHQLTGAALETSQQIGSNAITTEEAATCPQWRAHLDQGVQAANQKATSRAQAVGKWTLIVHDFSEKGGELTPTLKLKRAVTATKYEAEIEAMYA